MNKTRTRNIFEFIGHNLFIPIFFISIGFNINLGVFFSTLIDNALLVLAVVGGLILAKLMAALITQRLYRFTLLEGLLMWSLSLPQVAATLAALWSLLTEVPASISSNYQEYKRK